MANGETTGRNWITGGLMTNLRDYINDAIQEVLRLNEELKGVNQVDDGDIDDIIDETLINIKKRLIGE